MRYQRGGSFTVNGWLALLLLSLVAAEGAGIRHLLHEMQHLRWEAFGCQLQKPTADMVLPPTVIKPPDEYVTHAFPERREVCTGYDTICWIRI